MEGIAAEYAYIAKQNGEKFKDWEPVNQSVHSANGRYADVITIQLKQNGEIRKYYFDITDFFKQGF